MFDFCMYLHGSCISRPRALPCSKDFNISAAYPPLRPHLPLSTSSLPVVEGRKDGTSEAPVSHSARLLVLRTAAHRPLRWPRKKHQPPDETPEKYYFCTRDLKTVGLRVAFPTPCRLFHPQHLHTQPAADSSGSIAVFIETHRTAAVGPESGSGSRTSLKDKPLSRQRNIIHLI